MFKTIQNFNLREKQNRVETYNEGAKRDPLLNYFLFIKTAAI